MTTLRQDILAYADKMPSFEHWQLLQHLQKIRSKYDPVKALAELDKMTESGDIIKSPVPGAMKRTFQYSKGSVKT